MKNKYYVYTHSIDDEIIYVGKGTRYRATEFSKRSKRWHEIVGDNQNLVDVEIVKYFDDEFEAYKFEESLTAYYKSIGQCKANILIGKRHSQESKLKISEGGMGESNPMYGKKFSDEHRRKMSESQKLYNSRKKSSNALVL